MVRGTEWALAAVVAFGAWGCGKTESVDAGVPTTSDATRADVAVADAPDALQDAGADGPRDAADGAPKDAAADAHQDAADGAVACGTKACDATSVCVRTYVTGGACRVCQADGGPCGADQRCSGGCCVPLVPSYTYACVPRPAECAAALACGAPCGAALCTSGACPCEDVTGAVATCHCLAP